MGFDVNNDASAPPEPEAKKLLLRVAFEGVNRKVEWNTSWHVFKDMDTKVRRVFGISDKKRLVYNYQEPTLDFRGSTLDFRGSTRSILMSSDEELATALLCALVSSGILTLDVVLTGEKKKRKSAFQRVMRAAKPQVMNFATNVRARIPPVSVNDITERMRTCAQTCADTYAHVRACAAARFCCPRAHRPAAASPSAAVPPRRCRAGRKVFIGLFVLLIAVFIAHSRCHGGQHFRRDYQYHYRTHPENHEYHKTQDPRVHHQHHAHHQQQQVFEWFSHLGFNQWPAGNGNVNNNNNQGVGHVTILAATYGGHDVTKKFQEFYNTHKVVKASNSVFGDPDYGFRKYLHVVFQQIGNNGLAEVFSQTFTESEQLQQFNPVRSACAHPEEAIVDGKSVKVLGALYMDAVATCPARRLATTGYFSGRRAEDRVLGSNFGATPNPKGKLTLVYLKDNVLQVIKANEGETVKL